MSELVERIARALAAFDAFGGWDALSEGSRAEYRAEARVAILAMREPTPGMLEAAEEAHIALDLASDLPLSIWRSMINAALEEKV